MYPTPVMLGCVVAALWSADPVLLPLTSLRTRICTSFQRNLSLSLAVDQSDWVANLVSADSTTASIRFTPTKFADALKF